MTGKVDDVGRGIHGRRAAVVAALGVIALVIAALATGIGPGRAEAAVVTGRIADYAGGCLENANNATTANNPQQLNTCGTGAGQQWSRYSDGTLRVQGKCADLRSGATTANTRVVLATCSTTSTSQRWTLYANGFVQNQKSGTCLAPLGNQIYAKVAVTVTTCANVNAQKWALPAVPTTTVAPTTTPKPTTTTPKPTTVAPTTTPKPTAAPPTTAPPTTASPVPTQTSQTWNSDFSASGFGRFDDTPWNNVGASAPTIISSPVTSGAKAAQFTMPAGGTRTEIVPTTAEFTEGQERWFRFSFYLPAGFPTQVNSWQVLTQWKNDGEGSPPLEITAGSGNLKLEGGYGYPGTPQTFSQVIGPATTGKRTDLIVHVVFSRDPSRGTVDVWRDGTQAISGYKPTGGTLYPTTAASTDTVASYWKMGIYRDSAITQQAQYTIEGAKVGNTAAQVSN
ncbi:heparin lyase I family protein [Actinomycetospora sp.]|uniref:heparin lyase I family protein n=1 Tax=Actinomycetospora sp. TaxID=1872135 RepID=UPI002F41F129